MRALCGAIMSAGAFIGLGLTAIGVGMRYQMASQANALDWRHLDPALLVIIVLLVLAAMTGIGVSFLGLMYHHHRKHHEMLHAQGHGAASAQSSKLVV